MSFTIIISLVKNTIEDYQDRQISGDDKTNTYLAHDLVYRDLDTGKARFFYRENHDLIMRGEDIEPINISQIEREKEYEKLKNSPHQSRTTCYYAPVPKVARYGTMRGRRYKDLETRDIFVIRECNRKSFYVGLNDKKVKGYTDSQRKAYGNTNEKKDVINFQKEIDEALMSEYWKRNDATMIGCPGANINNYIDGDN